MSALRELAAKWVDATVKASHKPSVENLAAMIDAEGAFNRALTPTGDERAGRVLTAFALECVEEISSGFVPVRFYDIAQRHGLIVKTDGGWDAAPDVLAMIAPRDDEEEEASRDQ